MNESWHKLIAAVISAFIIVVGGIFAWSVSTNYGDEREVIRNTQPVFPTCNATYQPACWEGKMMLRVDCDSAIVLCDDEGS